jgi:hypothetical protein
MTVMEVDDMSVIEVHKDDITIMEDAKYHK